jgi:hypothetical protein
MRGEGGAKAEEIGGKVIGGDFTRITLKYQEAPVIEEKLQ